MAWLLFMDESGHSHKELPYEVRGGYALADTHLWPFVQDVLRLELSCFGARLADYKSEVKGMKLLSKDRFEHAAQMPEVENLKRQHLCRSLLQAGLEKRPPTREQLTAYGQASLRMADGIFVLLERHVGRPSCRRAHHRRRTSCARIIFFCWSGSSIFWRRNGRWACW